MPLICLSCSVSPDCDASNIMGETWVYIWTIDAKMPQRMCFRITAYAFI